MAEFSEIVKQARRLCEYYEDCRGCPLSRDKTGGVSNSLCRTITSIDENVAFEIERIVTEWAKEHPESMYPSWQKAWQSLFPYAEELCPGKLFGEDCPEGMLCTECRERPMSKKVAEKLGIKPITTEKAVHEHDGCQGCRWDDKSTDEEPCKNCCGVRGGSAPDLWE